MVWAPGAVEGGRGDGGQAGGRAREAAESNVLVWEGRRAAGPGGANTVRMCGF
jgi:hypothetical protein